MQVVSTTATAAAATKVATSHVVLVTVVVLLIVHLHAVDSASVQAALVVIALALVNAQVAASLIGAHHADVHLATALTAHRVTTALPIAKHNKMHAMIHAASLHQRHTVLSSVANAHRVLTLMRRVVILAEVILVPLRLRAKTSAQHRVTIHRVKTSAHRAPLRVAYAQL